MHVCHFCDTSLQGDYFRNIATGLSRRGVTVSLLELGPGKAPDWLSDLPGARYFSLNASGKYQYPMAVRRLARFLRDEQIDILHTHLFFAGIIGVLAKRLHKETTVALMRHHTGVVRMLGSRLHIAADRWMAEKAGHVLTVSKAAKRYMIDVDKIRRDGIDVVYLGFDFDKYSPNANERERVRRELGFEKTDFVIGYVANFAPGKGHLQLIEAFADIAEEAPNAKLLFVGRGWLSEVDEAARRWSSEKIIFAGWRDDVTACMNAMDVFVQPSLSEAFSQVLIEAMGCGLPVVATDVGGANEVIENRANGALIEANDSSAIAREVLNLTRSDQLRNKLADAGRSSVREKFGVERMVDRHMDLYESWMASR